MNDIEDQDETCGLTDLGVASEETKGSVWGYYDGGNGLYPI